MQACSCGATFYFEGVQRFNELESQDRNDPEQALANERWILLAGARVLIDTRLIILPLARARENHDQGKRSWSKYCGVSLLVCDSNGNSLEEQSIIACTISFILRRLPRYCGNLEQLTQTISDEESGS